MRVQIALGDLAVPGSFRNALRGVDTVIHLAASIRDQSHASLEELNGLATMRLVRAAERAGTRRFVFFSAMGATAQSPARFMRSKALAEQAVRAADMETTVFSPSIVYTPGDPWLTLLERLALLPAVPVSGSGRALLPAGLGRGRGRRRGGRAGAARGGRSRARSSWPAPRRSPTTRSCARRWARGAAPAAACTCRCRWCAAGLRALERVRGPRGLRHLGGGAADGGADDHVPRAPPTSRPWA